jgi:hypothetical protein
MAQIALLVETRLVQPEAVDNIDHHFHMIFNAFLLAALGRRVAADIKGLATDGDLLAVGLVDNAVNLFQAVGVGDDFVARDEILHSDTGRSALWWRLGWLGRGLRKV